MKSLALCWLLCGAPLAINAQGAPRLALGWGVDTIHTPHREIFDLWHSYIGDRPDSSHPNPYWSSEEQHSWPTYDLGGPQIYQGKEWGEGLQGTVVELDRVRPDDSTTYVIRTLFARVDRLSGTVLPVAMVRVYAIRENGRWALANSLWRLTAGWPRTTVGPITFVYYPGHVFDRQRAEHAARFVDSLAKALDVPPPHGITYIVAPTADELARVLGFDFALSPSGVTIPADRIIMSGTPQYGEWYPHELAHLVASPLTGARPSWFLNEGAATWFGGSRGLDYPAIVRELANVLCGRPSLGLDSVLAGHVDAVDSISRGAAAVVYQIAFERGGMSAVKQLIAARPETRVALDTALTQATKLPMSDLVGAWRTKVGEASTCASRAAPSS
jgi:hypothetical protein